MRILIAVRLHWSRYLCRHNRAAMHFRYKPDFASQLSDPFLKPDQAHSAPPYRRDVETNTIVANQNAKLTILRPDIHLYGLCLRMLGTVRQRLLHKPIDTGAMPLRQIGRNALNRGIYRYS